MTTEPVQCLTCERYALKGAPLGTQAFGQCKLWPKHTGMAATYPRFCLDHRPAPDDVVAARHRALAKFPQAARIAPHAAR